MSLVFVLLLIVGIGLAVALAPMPRALRVTLIVIGCVLGVLVIVTLLGGVDGGPRVHLWRD